MESQFVNLLIVDRYNGVVRTDKIAHSTPHTGVGRIGALVDTMIDAKEISGLFLQTDYNTYHSLPVNVQFNSPNRTHRCTAATESTFLFTPENAPGKVFCT